MLNTHISDTQYEIDTDKCFLINIIPPKDREYQLIFISMEVKHKLKI